MKYLLTKFNHPIGWNDDEYTPELCLITMRNVDYDNILTTLASINEKYKSIKDVEMITIRLAKSVKSYWLNYSTHMSSLEYDKFYQDTPSYKSLYTTLKETKRNFIIYDNIKEMHSVFSKGLNSNVAGLFSCTVNNFLCFYKDTFCFMKRGFDNNYGQFIIKTHDINVNKFIDGYVNTCLPCETEHEVLRFVSDSLGDLEL